MIIDFDVTPKAHPLVRATTAPTNYPAQFDLLFSPSGEVIGATDGLYAFVLRDSNIRPSTVNLGTQTELDVAGQLILTCVYTRTGAIATQPVSPVTAPVDPYKFAKDGINTGL
jgi:hypothetical protein